MAAKNFVATSKSSRFSSKTHIIDLNLRYGGRPDEACEWVLRLQRRTGRWAENEVLEVLDHFYFSNQPTLRKMLMVWRWMHQHKSGISVWSVLWGIKKAYAGMVKDLAWEREHILQAPAADTAVTRVNRRYSKAGIEIVDIAPYNAYCFVARVKIMGSKPHNVAVRMSDGEISHWFQRSSYISDETYEEAEEAVKFLWELIYKN